MRRLALLAPRARGGFLARSGESGQAAAEYAIVLFFAMLVLIGGWPIFRLFLEAVTIYFDSLYFVLNLPFP